MADETTAQNAGPAQPAVDAGGPQPTVDAGGPQPTVESGGPGHAVEADGPEPTVDTGGPGHIVGTGNRGDAGPGAGPGMPRARMAAIVLGAAAVLLGGFGAWATAQAHSLRASAAPANLALTDAAATSAVKRQVTSAVNTVFSYNYANTGATRRAAQRLLTGPAIRQYDTYFSLVTRDAPAQKLVVITRVTNAGVELLDGNRARVLVFANQQDTRAGTSQSSYAGALFAVTAVDQGGRWKIENIDTFNGQ